MADVPSGAGIETHALVHKAHSTTAVHCGAHPLPLLHVFLCGRQ